MTTQAATEDRESSRNSAVINILIYDKFHVNIAKSSLVPLHLGTQTDGCLVLVQ